MLSRWQSASKIEACQTSHAPWGPVVKLVPSELVPSDFAKYLLRYFASDTSISTLIRNAGALNGSLQSYLIYQISLIYFLHSSWQGIAAITITAPAIACPTPKVH